MRQSEHGWTVDFDFPFAGSYLVAFLNENLTQVVQKKKYEPIKNVLSKKTELLNLSTNWNGQKVRSFEIKRKGIEISISQTKLLKLIQLGVWNKWAGRGFSGDIEYINQFECNKEVIEKASELNLGNVLYACEVFLNGQSLGKRIWHPYSFNIQGKLQNGKNELRIIVTNTLANQYMTTRFFTKWSKMKLGPYHPKALKYERESLPSGLLGPVIIQ